MLINRAHCIPGIPTQGWWSEGRHSLNTPRQPYTCCGLPMSQAGGTTTACTLPAAASPSWHITAHQAWATAEGKGKCLCAAWGPSCATAQHAQLSYHDQNDLFFSLPHSKQIMRCTGSLFEEKGPKCHILINKQQFLTFLFLKTDVSPTLQLCLFTRQSTLASLPKLQLATKPYCCLLSNLKMLEGSSIYLACYFCHYLQSPSFLLNIHCHFWKL